MTDTTLTDTTLTDTEREALGQIDLTCPSCGHEFRRHYQQHPGCRLCRFPADWPAVVSTDCEHTLTSAQAVAIAPSVEAIVAARVADRDNEWRERIEALAANYDSDNWHAWGIPQAIRALAAEARTQGGA